MTLTFEELLSDQTVTTKWIVNFVDNTTKVKKSSITIGYLRKRMELMETYWDSFTKNHHAIARLTEFENSDYNQGDVFGETELSYNEHVAWFEAEIAKKQAAAAAAGSSSGTATIANPASAEAVVRQIQLPKIELPVFDGNPLEWESFRDLFDTMIIKVPGLNNVQKLIYLKSRLTGEAASLISNTQMTDNAFDGAWEDLNARYGNPRIISSFHMKNLFEIEQVTKASPVELRRLLDAFRQSIRAFRTMKKPIHHWDEFFVYILVQKIDRSTRYAWETSLADSKEIPTFQALTDFIENRVHALEFTSSNGESILGGKSQKSSNQDASGKSNKRFPVNKNALAATKGSETDQHSNSNASKTKGKGKSKSQQPPCVLCSGDHGLSFCPQFLNMAPGSRDHKVNFLKLCRNCLRPGHFQSECRSDHRCRACSRDHHTLLHAGIAEKQSTHTSTRDDCYDNTASSTQHNKTVTCCTLASVANRTVLLATARIQLSDKNGHTLVVRALLDPGAESTLISEEAAQKLNLSRKSVNVQIQGVQACSTGTSTHEVAVTINSLKSPKYSINIHALVLRKLTSLIPSSPVRPASWNHIQGLPLADPDFASPGEIDLIIGADLCGHILLGDKRTGTLNEPTACNTPFGWVLMGPVDVSKSNVRRTHLVTLHHTYGQPSFEKFWHHKDDDGYEVDPKNVLLSETRVSPQHDEDCILHSLQRFWEIEEVSNVTRLSKEEQQCEEFYVKTHTRDKEGRYTVRLPFRLEPSDNLTLNKQAATAMQLSNERKAASNPAFKNEYEKFMLAYLEMGHMTLLTSDSNPGTFLPHHGIYRSLPSPKFRVVFNASFKTSQGKTLNNCLMAGPKLQSELWVIVTRARQYRYAFTADIVKMFRQVNIHSDDIKWQQIVWRQEPTQRMQAFALNTVTYGTASAPYLALRTLLQLADDEEQRFPLGAQAIRQSAYVDDFFPGGSTLLLALEVKRQLIGILQAGGFELSKWASNAPELCLATVDTEKHFDFDTISTLGLIWNPRGDHFSLKINMDDFQKGQPTKRTVLSDIARLFDPLGWYSPVLILAKILIQDMWLLGIDWDQPLPPEAHKQWENFKSKLPLLETIIIPRWLDIDTASHIELHVFTDASERAYSATVYMRVLVPGVRSSAKLVVAKTKVAPVKSLSIPRLELCGALLGAKLAHQVHEKLDLASAPTFAWVDSQVTLAWIQAHASRWTPFVANRVSKIQSILHPDNWRHVRTHENPADLATRGITTEDLTSSSLWWYGLNWLGDPHFKPERNESIETTSLEQKRNAAVHVLHATVDADIFHRYSELKTLVRVVAYCLRFTRNLRHHRATKRLIAVNLVQPLTTSELTDAQRRLILVSQRQFFAEEIGALQNKAKLPINSPIRSLRPFIDENDLMRVGGRLQQAELSFDEKHPVILHKNSRLSYLVIKEAHHKTLHGGPQLSISHVIRKYWITHVQMLAKQVYRECVTCTRFAARTLTQIMGNLPALRVNAIRPFLATGLDYAGPVMLRTTKGRGYKAYKGWIAVFVCLATKAVHLEAVSDLTSLGFLAALRRFVSRRGHVQTLASDNGTNFHGADRELREMFSEASEFYKNTCISLADEGTEWTFIPPAAPHMGGIWEAAVKSTKHHLKRVVGNSTLTFEEMTTLLCQIEACLNSRPLIDISGHPDDLAPLTPGHFLVGHALTVLPEPGTVNFDITPAKRHAVLTKMRDDFWRRWKVEYLSTLQVRTRWCDPSKDMKLGALVLIKDETTPPAKWPLARVVAVHHGPDGHVRAVTVKTATSEFQRPIHKLCLLPVASNEVQQCSDTSD